MNGYGSHTYSLWNNSGERFWVKFHLKTRQRQPAFRQCRSGEGDRENPASGAQEDLYQAIEEGHCPKRKFFVQIMPELDAEKTSYNPFDLTKFWPHSEYPLKRPRPGARAGSLRLN